MVEGEKHTYLAKVAALAKARRNCGASPLFWNPACSKTTSEIRPNLLDDARYVSTSYSTHNQLKKASTHPTLSAATEPCTTQILNSSFQGPQHDQNPFSSPTSAPLRKHKGFHAALYGIYIYIYRYLCIYISHTHIYIYMYTHDVCIYIRISRPQS